MDFMLGSGLTIYLKMTPSGLKKRLVRSSEGRPLLKNIDKKDLGEYISSKLAEREKWYSRADITIDGFNIDLSHFFSLVKNWIRQ